MSDYKAVSEALDKGADPEMLCATCPWDRFCITPPTMTRSEVEAKTALPPKASEGSPPSDKDLFSGLMNVVIFGGKDTQAQVCPVFALRLRTNEGKQLNEMIRATMQASVST